MSHLAPIDASAKRAPIEENAADFIAWVRDVRAERPSLVEEPAALTRD